MDSEKHGVTKGPMRLVKDYLFYLLVTILLVLGYINASVLWVDIRYAKPALFRTEIPLLALVLTILYFGKLQSRFSKYLLPLTPIILAYLGFDLFYNNLGRAPRPSDLRTIQEVLLFSPLIGTGIILFLMAPLASVGLLLGQAAKAYPRDEFLRLLQYKAIAAVTCILLLYAVFSFYHESWFRYIPQSQKATIRHNGRISSFIYYFWHERENREKLLAYTSDSVQIGDTLYPGEPLRTPDIHLIVLESFIDPRMVEGVRFNRSPLAEELRRLLGKRGFDLVYSPAYGGNTAQPEFELLSGIKAYAKVESVEFNVMNGGAIHAFLHRLKTHGYRTLGTIATGFGYFNSKQAYRSLGLDDVVYLEEGDLPRQGDRRVFDGDLFQANLQRIRKRIAEGKGPVFNYLLGMYGHMPYDRNPRLRPDVIQVTPANERLRRIANQFYYRTRALGNYLEELLAIDPDAIIFVSSDHLPPIFGPTLRYSEDKYTNIALLFDAGERIDENGKRYYEIPWQIWDRLTGKTHRRPIRIPGEETTSPRPGAGGNRDVAAPASSGTASCTKTSPLVPCISMEELYFEALHESQ